MGQGVITATTPALSVCYIQPLLVSSLAVVLWSSLRFCPSAGAGRLGAPWQILLWNKLLCWVWNIWLQSTKLSTRVICRAKWKRFFLSGYPVACFHGWQQLILVIFGLSARPGTTWTLWQLNMLSAGGNICKDLILCTLAAFSKEHWNIFPWAQEIVSTQTFHAVLGE